MTALSFVLLGAVAWHGSLRRATGPAQGGPLSPPGSLVPQKKTFRIGTFNIHSGRGRDGRLDLDRVAKCLEGLDFVGLNEVAGRWPWQAADQARELGRLTGRASLFAPFERRWYCYGFGNGLLSSLPVAAWQRVPLSEASDRPRNAVLAQVELGPHPLEAILTHASRRDPQQRDEEIRWAVHRFLAASEPAALLGDMNAGPDHPLLKRLAATPGVVDALAGAPGVPQDRIDWILLRGLRLVRAGMVERDASDHPLFWAEVELRPGVE